MAFVTEYTETLQPISKPPQNLRLTIGRPGDQDIMQLIKLLAIGDPDIKNPASTSPLFYAISTDNAMPWLGWPGGC